jgi:broad specificity phosphatase PhoE
MTVEGSDATLTLVIARHGQTEHNAGRRYQGHSDSPLTAVGRAQARRLGSLLATVGGRDVRIVSSDLGRAVETARLAFPGVPVATDPRLREMGFGRFEGHTHEACLRSDGPAYRAWLDDPLENCPPGGETFAAFADRIDEWLDEQPRTGATVAITHGGPVFHLLSRIQRISFAAAMANGFAHGAACRIEITTGGPGSGPVRLRGNARVIR